MKLKQLINQPAFIQKKTRLIYPCNFLPVMQSRIPIFVYPLNKRSHMHIDCSAVKQPYM